MREFEIILGLVFVATLLQPIARCFDVPLAIAQVFVALVLVTIAAVAAVLTRLHREFPGLQRLFLAPACHQRCRTAGP